MKHKARRKRKPVNRRAVRRARAVLASGRPTAEGITRRVTAAAGGAKITGFYKDSPVEITKAAALEAGRRVLEAGLRQCARGKHLYKDPAARQGWGPCSRCGRSISRRARRNGEGVYALNPKRIH